MNNTSHKWTKCTNKDNRWYLMPSDVIYCPDRDLLALEQRGDAFMVDDSFTNIWKWRPLDGIKSMDEAKAVCETLWRMR